MPQAAKIRVGLIGCGTIAQIAHLPFLRELHDRFTIAALCDVIPDTLAAVGDQYNVPPHARFDDFHALCESDLVDAVMVCHNGSHVPPALAALRARKHVIVEKPLTSSVREAESLVAAAREAKAQWGGVALMAYMKQFDAGFQYVHRLLKPRLASNQITYVDSRHIHSHNPLYESHHTLLRGSGGPASAASLPGGSAGQASAASEAPEESARGSRGSAASPEPAEPWQQISHDPSANQRRVLTGIGSSIHDIYCLRTLLGPPISILSSQVIQSGRTALFQYPNDVLVNYAWIDIGPVRNFRQEFVLYGSDIHVSLRFPQPYRLSAPTEVVVNQMEPAPDVSAHLGPFDAAGLSKQEHGPPLSENRITASYQDAYKLEWVHFHACITQGIPPLATVEDALLDTKFFVDWAKATK